MDNKVNKIMLFTLSACPVGRSMGTVLNETRIHFPQVDIKTIYVEMEPDITNQYKIKKNVTTLFLDGQHQELYRLEGFVETAEMIKTIENINNGTILSSETYEQNKGSMEFYTVYLYNDEEEIVPINMPYYNQTSVQAPNGDPLTH